MLTPTLILSLLLAQSPETALAELPRVSAVRTEVAPVIDGVLEPEVWDAAVVIDDFGQVEPREGQPPSERTEVRVLYDSETIYVAFRCFDRDPDAIIATTMRRDDGLGSDDRVDLLLDPFGDRRNGFQFSVNALGAKRDAIIENSDRTRVDWDGIWYAASSIDGEGWITEIAIPVRTMAFDPNAAAWSLNASRSIRRRNETVRWASPSQNKRFISVGDAGYLDALEGLAEAAGVDVVPYVVGGVRRDHDADDNRYTFDGGGDIFYRPIPSLTFALTVNTDFAETEVDDRRVNLTRFPLFFPEKRDFFLQDSWIFTFGGIRRNPLPFQSRRIGIGPDGETRDILVGAKLTGRIDRVSLGLLDVQMKDDDVLGNKNLFVGRATVDVLEQSTVGAIFTAGDPSTTGDNALGGLDFNYRNSNFNGDKVLEGHAWVQRSESSGDGGDDWSYGFKVEYPNDIVNWRAGYTQIGDEFTAALGFVPRRGINEFFYGWRYRWRPESGNIRNIDAGINTFFITDLSGDVESSDVGVDLEFETIEGDELRFELSQDREVILDPFEISDGVVIPVDDYRYGRYSISAETSNGRPLSLDVGWTGGQFYTGTRDDYTIGLDWRVSPNLFLGADYSINDVSLPEGDFIARVIRGRVNVYFTPDVSWTNFVQYDNFSETIGVNSRVRWIVEPGNEMYFVLNQSVSREDDSYRVLQTELTTKIGWTFRF